MYNRYIPQADGSYCRHSVPDKVKRPQKPAPVQEQPPKACPAPAAPCRPQPRQESAQSGGLLQKLIPGGLDTEDLLVILLLLLIAGDCREDQSFALLTLGLYLFM